MPVYTRPAKGDPAMDQPESWGSPVIGKGSDGFADGPSTQPVRQRSNRVNRPATTNHPISVLFVDEYNEVRSVIAHAQAEIIRLWTLNRRGYNLFSAVDSAGLQVETSLTRKGQWRFNRTAGDAAYQPAVEAVMGNPQSKEGQDIKTRFATQHRTRGLEYDDFDKFDFILAFDLATLTDLRNLEWVAYRRAQRLGRSGLRAKTKYIGDFNARHSRGLQIPKPDVGRTPSRRDFDGIVRLVEQEMQNFLRAVTGWTKPERLTLDVPTTRYFSRQFVAKKSRITDAHLRTLKLLYDKKVMVDDEVPSRDYRTVTITAKDSQLREVLDNTRAAFL